MARSKVNIKVVIQSIAALICIALMFLVSWWFVVPAGILFWLNQRELFKGK
jgi:ABC-type bacteriocin/lantibiotic exporter with double-glycine peptidase domain